MGLLHRPDNKNKNSRENIRDHRTLKGPATKANTKQEEADDYKAVLSDLKFTVVDAPD